MNLTNELANNFDVGALSRCMFQVAHTYHIGCFQQVGCLKIFLENVIGS